eukprot:3035031-Alexandrium_andersonii.AAC.1
MRAAPLAVLSGRIHARMGVCARSRGWSLPPLRACMCPSLRAAPIDMLRGSEPRWRMRPRG